MTRPFKNHMKRLAVLISIFIFGTIGISLLCSDPALADWYSDLGLKYTVYKKNSDFLYWNGKDNSWKILSNVNNPRVNLNGTSCDTADSNIDFDSSATYYNCVGLIISANTQTDWFTDWFNEANLAFKIGDFDSKETVSVSGGRITRKGSMNEVTIASDGKSAYSDSTGCSGGNPNRTDGCSILVVFNYGYGDSFKINLNNQWNGAGKTGSSGHEFWYDGPSTGAYRTLTFNPNGGTVVDNKLQTDNTIGDESTLWSHESGSNVLREYKKDVTANEYPIPTRAGYIFQGWYTAANSGNHSLSRIMSNDETLYSHWVAQDTNHYALSPLVSISGNKTTIELGEDFGVDMSIANEGSIDSDAAGWGLSKSINGVDIGSYAVSGSGVVFQKNKTWTNSYPESSTDNLSVGDKLCYMLRVNPSSIPRTDPTYADSNIVCVVVSKKPKVQIWGGDLWAGGAVKASTSVFGGRTFGSWIEYGIFAAQSVNGAASAAAYSVLGFADTFCKASKLSFTNVNCATSGVGGYSSSHTLSDVAASFPGGITTSSPITAQFLASGTYAVGDVTLKASELPQSRSVIINSSGTVTIIGNQTYQGGSYDSIDKIPQLVIIAAGDINIYGDVTQIDAWLVANGGVINTCSDVPISVPLNSTICKNKLVVNGPISAQKLYLRRTFGDGKSSAETFNLRADALVWAANRATVSNGVRTVYSTELPPRF